jgi:hypothetical protein
MVAWLSPPLLVRTGVDVALASAFGTFADKREMQVVLTDRPPAGWAGAPELWFDFVADLGDAFGPTYSIATLLAAPTLPLVDRGGSIETRRGQVLVMGGDEVYPVASPEGYRDRLVGPYRAALPYTESDHPHLYALPGNHDWYDGLTSFLRVFCRGQWVGGWRTQQSRSYFTVPLPHGWHLWGVDIQLDSYIDEPQLEYLRAAAASLQAGDRVILCSAVPSWVHANQDEPDAFRNIDYIERTVIRPTGATVALALTGDAHHYAHYRTADGSCHRVTAGGGGAFTSSTHHLPERLLVPPPGSTDPGRTTPPAELALVRRWPDRGESEALRRRVFRLPFLNPSFVALVGAVHLVLLWSLQGSRRAAGTGFVGALRHAGIDDVVTGLAGSPVAWLVGAVLVLGLASFTKSRRPLERYGVGLAHGLAHLAAAAGWIVAASWACSGIDGDAWFTLALLVVVGAGGGLVGSWVMALYLVVADHLGLNANELFAAQRLRSHKNFLRLHIDADGGLTVYPIGLRAPARRWVLRADGAPADQPWFTTDQPLEPELVEAPFRVGA